MNAGLNWVTENLIKIIGNEEKAVEVLQWLQEENLLNIHYGNEEVNVIIDGFKQAFGTTKTSRYDRFAAKRLANKHGSDLVVKLIQALASRSGEKYAPTVNNVSQLEEKLPSVVKFVRGQEGVSVGEL